MALDLYDLQELIDKEETYINVQTHRSITLAPGNHFIPVDDFRIDEDGDLIIMCKIE